MNAKETFKEMLSLCYEEEDFIELHKELVSLAASTKKSRDYEKGMEDVLTTIPLFSDGFPSDVFSTIENLYQEFIENE